MKVLVFCAKGFETMEFSVFIDILGWTRNDYGYDIKVDTCGFQKEAYRQKQLAEFGVNVINQRIVVDENIITSYCPETAPDVGYKLLKKLVGYEKMIVVKQAMGY